MTKEEVIGAIYAGVMDDHFDDLYAAAKQRNKFLCAQQVLVLSKDDVVQFTSDARPKYLVGVQGVVTAKNDTTVVVKMPDNIIGDLGGRFEGYEVTVPAAILEKV